MFDISITIFIDNYKKKITNTFRRFFRRYISQ